MSQPVTLTSRHESRLRGAERLIFGNLGAKPWSPDRLTKENLKAARSELRALRAAAGFKGLGRWLTTSETSSKLAKSGLPTIGVTLHAAKRAGEFWAVLPEEDQWAIAGALGLDPITVGIDLKGTFCPCASKGCLEDGVCVTQFSTNAAFDSALRSRLCRALLFLYRPDAAFTLLAHELERLFAAHGDHSRWRVNISDDIRWELLAPALFDIGVPGYAYTKYRPTHRQGSERLSLVYSATERMADEEIHSLVSEGHRVAVVFDVPRKKLPTCWQGITVVDGDKTDDLWSHPSGAIVGLSAKGRTRDVKRRMAESGFARPAE